jgi:hypothetical protein
MIQQNGALLPQPDLSKRKGNYTGERLKVLRPETYRLVVRLLAEPCEHVSIREICRQDRGSQSPPLRECPTFFLDQRTRVLPNSA